MLFYYGATYWRASARPEELDWRWRKTSHLARNERRKTSSSPLSTGPYVICIEPKSEARPPAYNAQRPREPLEIQNRSPNIKKEINVFSFLRSWPNSLGQLTFFRHSSQATFPPRAKAGRRSHGKQGYTESIFISNRVDQRKKCPTTDEHESPAEPESIISYETYRG